MNIFPFAGVTYIMYYHGKHGAWLAILQIQWDVILAELEDLAYVGNVAKFTADGSCIHGFFQHFRHLQVNTEEEIWLCKGYPVKKTTLRDDKPEFSL